jgi:transposase-like protein
MHRVHQDEKLREELMLDLDEIARQGARRMLAKALEAEVEFYIEAARGERDERGHALVVRNGYAKEREILLGAGAVEVKAPRVNDRRVDEDGNRQRFKSLIVPPYMRRSPKVTEVLPLLYLHGLSREISSRLWRSSSAVRLVFRHRPSPASPSAGNPSGRAL